MLRVELFGVAVTFTVMWCIAFVYSLGTGGQPPTGLIMTVMTIVTAGSWFIIWARHVRHQLQAMRREVQSLREERDVSEAMRRIRHLRVVRHDS
jgi:hypothetical protein